MLSNAKTKLSWHISSTLARLAQEGEGGASNASQGQDVAFCGTGFTVGHYDPWLKCDAANSTDNVCTNHKDNAQQ